MTIPPNESTHGYDRLGRLMGRYGDMSIFRRFGALSAERLLHLQAELQGLENDLREQQDEDRRSSDPDRREYYRNWNRLDASGDPDAPEDSSSNQLSILRDIDDKLKRYYKALLLHQQVMTLGKPTERQVKSLADWMDRPDRGAVYLTGPDRHIWRNPDMDDLAIVSTGSKLVPDLVYWYHEIIGRRIHKAETNEDMPNTVVYNDAGVITIIKTLATLVACLLLMASIAVLYTIKSMPLRIGVTAIFTSAFALSLNATTDAKIKDIFSATATFAAVLVVFIGTNDNTD